MKESDTYQAILDEGKAEGKIEEAKGMLLRLGERRFGLPDATTRKSLEAITGLPELEQLIFRLLEVESWTELLDSE